MAKKDQSTKHESNAMLTINKIKDIFGNESIQSFDKTSNDNIQVIQTGSLKIDECTGIGGIPCGRIIEVFGTEGSGKTTFAIHIIANLHAMTSKHNSNNEGHCLYIDLEQTFNKKYAVKLGIDLKRLHIAQPNNGEEAFNIIEKCIEEGGIDLIILDSIAALVPAQELEAQIGEQSMGLLARLMGSGLKRIINAMTKAQHRIRASGSKEFEPTVVFINQLRSTIGSYIKTDITTGGRALPYFASMRIGFQRITGIKDKNSIEIGQHVRVKVVKNKLANPHQNCEIQIIYGQGIDSNSEIIDIAVQRGIFQKNGSWYQHGDRKLGQGENAVMRILNEDPEYKEQIKKLIHESFLNTDTKVDMNYENEPSTPEDTEILDGQTE